MSCQKCKLFLLSSFCTLLATMAIAHNLIDILSNELIFVSITRLYVVKTIGDLFRLSIRRNWTSFIHTLRNFCRLELIWLRKFQCHSSYRNIFIEAYNKVIFFVNIIPFHLNFDTSSTLKIIYL